MTAAVQDNSPEPAVPAAVAERDLRGLGWWLVEAVVCEQIKTPSAGIVASIMRVLHALGPGAAAEGEALRDVELVGLVMSGLPPRNEEEWARARELFSEETLQELSHWKPRG